MNDGVLWGQILAVTGMMLVAYGFLYMRYFRKAVTTTKHPFSAKGDEWFGLFALLIVSFMMHAILAYCYQGFDTDMNLFKTWGKQMLDQGLGSAYRSDTFVDYTPGYLYVLKFVEWFVRLLGLEAFQVQGLANMIYKMPACLCDLGAGYFIYRIARERMSKNLSLLAVAAYLFNPGVVFNSAVWGQVDGILTLAVIAMLYFITKKKLPIAYFICIIGVIIKAQMMFFAPILLWAIVEQVFLEDFNWRKFWINLSAGLCSLLMGLLMMVPFGVGRTIAQYRETMGSYEYATVNAFNFWGMLGLNWKPQTEKFLGIPANTWGSMFLAAAVLFAVLLCYHMRKKPHKYYFSAAVLLILIFTFSVRMHERYVFPALVCLLIAYCIKPRKQIFFAYVGLSVAQFLNVGFIYKIYPGYVGYTSERMPEVVVCSFLMVAVMVYVLYIAVRWGLREETGQEMFQKQLEKDAEPAKEKHMFEGITPSKVFAKITITDICIMVAIMCIYSAVALFDLGDGKEKVPHTEYYSECEGDEFYAPPIVLDMGNDPRVDKVAVFLGNYEARKFSVEGSDSLDGTWVSCGRIETDGVLCWSEYPISSNYRYLRLTSENNAVSLFELVVLNIDGDIITPLNADSEQYSNLFDENMTYGEKTKLNSAYFDEVYHARTAYEYIQGRYSYENTHPPLGKCFIALGMLIFGVCPFGWRIMGVLFGIAMIPFIYLFAKRMFKETWIATCTAILFSFDFMHFAQTRLATIDVFVTFFIIGMYYFMYKYVSMSFYDHELKKTWVPLGLSGLFMGFGVASKWTGAYAGIGLAVIFFTSLFRRYREYIYARNYGAGTTNGISHDEVVKKFKPYVIKTLAMCVIFFIVVPCIIYALSYLPFRDGTNKGWIAEMLRNQETMFGYHSKLVSTHPYSSKWYNWPTMYRPIWYYSRSVTDTVSEGISAFGNPLVWWVGIPAFIYMLYLIWKDRDRKALFLSLAFLAQYLPWCLISRTTYIYHFFPSVPFITLMIGYSMTKMVGESAKKRRIVYFYVAAAVGMFLLFYPILSGQPIEKQWVIDKLRWFDTWVFIS